MINLQELIGTRLQYIGRACDVCWLGFGDLREVHDHNENPRTVATYALHIPSAFRLWLPGSPLHRIGHDDMFSPCGGGEHPENFEWDVQGGNYYDEKVDRLQEDTELMQGMIIEAVEVSELYDLKIRFKNGYLLETFSQCFCSDVELWRLFRPYQDEEHLIVMGNGVEQ